VESSVGRLLRRAAECGDATAQGEAKDILKHEPALFTFVLATSAEPTNNAAERALRGAVLWRKISFGTDSEHGSRFIERILTVVTTLRQLRRNVPGKPDLRRSSRPPALATALTLSPE